MTRYLAGVVLALMTAGCGGAGQTPGALLPAGGAGSAGAAPAAPRDGLVTEGYAPPDSCAACHADVAKSYASVAMARSFGRPESLPVIEDYTGRNRLAHAPSRFLYD